MINLEFYYFNFSTYLLMIAIAFVVSFLLFYKITKQEYNKIDIWYVYVLNIFGFGFGAKLLSFIVSGKSISLLNFLKSGFAFLGGILGSIFVVFLYSKKYKLNFQKLLSKFVVVYPLIYSISKIGCLLNSCCNGQVFKVPIQIVDSVVMIFLTMWLYKNVEDKCISKFFIVFGSFRFVEDFLRIFRKIIFGIFTLDQIICILFVFVGVAVGLKNRPLKHVPDGRRRSRRLENAHQKSKVYKIV